MTSTLFVEELKGRTSGTNANKVIVPSGQKIAGTDTVHIDASGIGVNINNPLSPIHVTEAAGGDTAGIFIDGPTDGDSVLYMGDSDDIDIGSIQYNHSSNFMAFRTNAAERMRINSSGALLINTTQEFDSLNGRGNLVVGSGSGNEGITIYSGNDSQGGIIFADGTSGTTAYPGQIQYTHSYIYLPHSFD